MNSSLESEKNAVHEELDRPKILIVDDRPDNLIVLERLLKNKNVELFKAGSGNEALKLTLHHDFALALLDIQMPGMDGYELAELLRADERTAKLPFIFISAIYTDHINIFRGYERGAFSYITKPFDPQVLLNKVEFFIEKYQQEQALKRAQNVLERRVRERTRDLERSNKELEQFAYVATHDLRAPIINLKALMEIFRKKGFITDENRTIVEKLGGNIDNIHETLHDLIGIVAYKKTHEQTMSEIRFASILEDILSSIEEQVEMSQVTIHHDFSKVPVITYLPSHIKSILQNLLINAIKYRSPDRPPVVHIWSDLHEGFIRLSIRDNGIGIDPRHHDQVFGLFKRFYLGVEGKGIGLFITKSQVESLNGKIDFESIPGEGTTFRVYLKNQRQYDR